MNKLLQILEERRNVLDISQEKMARKLSVSLKTYNNWVNKKYPPNFENRFKIRRLLEVLDREYIYCENEDVYLEVPANMDQLSDDDPCPICEGKDCWTYTTFMDSFKFDDIIGPASATREFEYRVDGYSIKRQPKHYEYGPEI